MLFKLTGQAFLVPAAIMALGFFILYASSRLENRIETRGIKLYGLFTVALLSMCAAFLILGGIFDKDYPGSSKDLPVMPHRGQIPLEPSEPKGGAGVPNGDEEMTLNPDEQTTESESLHKKLEALRRWMTPVAPPQKNKQPLKL